MDIVDEKTVAEAAKESVTRAEITDKVKQRLEGLAAEGRLGDFSAETPANQFRAFVAPVERFTRYLVKTGTPKAVRDPNSPTGERLVSRVGDVFVEFQDGIVVLNVNDAEDALKIAWCEKHPAICRDIEDPFTEAWAYMKELQQETSRSSKRLPESVDLEAVLRGDARGSRVPHDAVNRARTQKERMEAGS